MVSLSLWLCSLTPSAPRMNARPLELPAMRPVSGVDSTSIRFFHTPVRMKRENTAPGEKNTSHKRLNEVKDVTQQIGRQISSAKQSCYSVFIQLVAGVADAHAHKTTTKKLKRAYLSSGE